MTNEDLGRMDPVEGGRYGLVGRNETLWEFALSPKQREAMRVLRDCCPKCTVSNANRFKEGERWFVRCRSCGEVYPAIDEVLFGGGQGPGKTLLGCVWCVLRGYDVAQMCGLTVGAKVKPTLGWMGMKRGVDFMDKVMPKFQRFVPSGLWRVREQARKIVVADMFQIAYGGLDANEDIEKMRGGEYAYAFVDQAEELTRDDVGALRAGLRFIMRGVQPPRKTLFTANPSKCWLIPEFIEKPTPKLLFIPALYTDNPWLPPDYGEQMEHAYRHRPNLLRAMKYGEWEALESPDQLVRKSWVEDAAQFKPVVKNPFRVIGCDPARDGDDETVILCGQDTDIMREEVYGKKDTMFTVQRLAYQRRFWKADLIAIDDLTFGGGVVDRLRELGEPVLAINGAASAADKDRFRNLRSELYYLMAEEFGDKSISLYYGEGRDKLPPEDGGRDEMLIQELCEPTVEFRNGKIAVESKIQVKARLRRSPDRGDAFVYMLAGLRLLKGTGRMGEGMRKYEPEPQASGGPPPDSYAAMRAEWERNQQRSETDGWDD